MIRNDNSNQMAQREDTQRMSTHQVNTLAVNTQIHAFPVNAQRDQDGYLQLDISDDDSIYSVEWEESRQLEENLQTLKIVWQCLVIPTVSRWIGRRVALWERDENYEFQCRSKGIIPIFIPTLCETLELNKLNKLLSQNSPNSYWGVITTSKRASLAFKQAFLVVQTNQSTLCTQVGRITAKPLLSLNCQVQGAEETGNATSLANLIINLVKTKNIDSRVPFTQKKLLFLTGDKTRPDLPSILTAHQINYDTLQVYQTAPHPQLQQALHSIPTLPTTDIWCVFFSPSGAELVLPYLQQLPLFSQFCIATLGTTTQTYLNTQSISVQVVPTTPTPEALVEAILNSSKKMKNTTLPQSLST